MYAGQWSPLSLTHSVPLIPLNVDDFYANQTEYTQSGSVRPVISMGLGQQTFASNQVNEVITVAPWIDSPLFISDDDELITAEYFKGLAEITINMEGATNNLKLTNLACSNLGSSSTSGMTSTFIVIRADESGEYSPV